jgi:hypothetical protein
VSIAVYLQALRDAAGQWEDRAEELRGARTSLTGADTGLLGSRVGPVAAEFINTWADEVRRLTTDAEAHGQALRDSATFFGAADAETVQRMQDLLPWTSRHASPTATP